MNICLAVDCFLKSLVSPNCLLIQVKTADNHIIQQQLSQKVQILKLLPSIIFFILLLVKRVLWHSQIHECESLQETIGSLKHQLADALELRNLSPQPFSVTKDYHGEPHLDKESAMITNTNEKILLQEQVFYLFIHCGIYIEWCYYDLNRLIPCDFS